MGAKRKSGPTDAGGKKTKTDGLLALPVPAADMKKQEHLKMFDEWLSFGFKPVSLCIEVSV